MSAVEARSSPRGYHLFAPIYDAVFGLSLHHGRRVAIRALDCRPGEHILEVGVGSGLSLGLYPHGVHVTAVDLSADMLALARPRAARLRNVSLVRMNAERLALADGTFDRAVMLFAVAGLPNPVLALEEMRRVVRPGGTIVIAGHFRSQRKLDRMFDALLAPIYRIIGYREDLDRNALLTACGLELVSAVPVNLFGYSSVLVCRNRRRRVRAGSPLAKPPTEIAPQGCATAAPGRLPS